LEELLLLFFYSSVCLVKFNWYKLGKHELRVNGYKMSVFYS
jgi:hypothetical protein